MAIIDIKDENLQKLLKIQKVFHFEDGQKLDLDETLARVIAFYRRYVPYN